MVFDEIPNLLFGFGPDAPTVAQVVDELAVIEGRQAELRFRHSGRAQKRLNVL